MFDLSIFKEVHEKQEFEMADNGFILRVSGRTFDDDYINRSFVFASEEEFFEAVRKTVSWPRD